jgi:hypothetical protein
MGSLLAGVVLGAVSATVVYLLSAPRGHQRATRDPARRGHRERITAPTGAAAVAERPASTLVIPRGRGWAAARLTALLVVIGVGTAVVLALVVAAGVHVLVNSL